MPCHCTASQRLCYILLCCSIAAHFLFMLCHCKSILICSELLHCKSIPCNSIANRLSSMRCHSPLRFAVATRFCSMLCRCLSKLRLASIAIAFPSFFLPFHCSSEPCFAMPLQVSSNQRIAVAAQVVSFPGIALAFLSQSSLCRCRSTPSAARPHPAIAII